jgi:uncharacterized radical SAM superfamily protein
MVRINLEAVILIKNEPPDDRGGTLPTWGTKMSKLSTRGSDSIIAHFKNNARQAIKNPQQRGLISAEGKKMGEK